MQLLPTYSSNRLLFPFSLDQRIAEAIAEARAITAEYGVTSTKAAVAWDIVEELEAEAAHQRIANQHRTAFTDYCDAFPDALEARMYEL